MRHAQQAQRPPPPFPPQPDRRRPTVLLVQSDQDNREMYAEYLRLKGFDPISASTVEEALALAADAHVIVTGIALPGDQDGVALISRLRTNQETQHVPIVALTTFVGNAERAAAAGCDRWLLKPCLPDELLACVRRAMRDSGRPARGR